MSLNSSRIEETAETIRAIQINNIEAEPDAAELTKTRQKNAINKIKSMKNGSIITIPISLIDLSKNKRDEEINENDPDFIQLTESINEIGLIHKPIITIDENSIFPLEGHRRIVALKRLGNESVSCEVKILERDELNQLTSLIANTARKNWKIIAIAKSLNVLYEKAFTQEKLAKLIGKDRTTVLRLLKISNWNEDIHKLIIDNYDKVTQKSLLNIASRKLTDDEVLNELKILCGIIQRKNSNTEVKYLKNKNKFKEYVKTKNYSDIEIKLIEEALMEFGIL
ncbi:ParB/RepB/Spo0J family partition protein [Silvanigrella sp.]|jgi:ParB family chromosome partitioning protein|uniref:ParB/RepB/Spo0J family partition protein n=1 Tax=Silvanigrella sp. TaxID=2024976 RepID=UPI0037C77436